MKIVSFTIKKKVHTILMFPVASELVKMRLKYSCGRDEMFTAPGYVIWYIFIVYNKTRIKSREVY